MRAITDIYVTANQYEVERCCDYVTIGTTQYRGTGNGPLNVHMRAGETIAWRSDGSVTLGGFQICASTTSQQLWTRERARGTVTAVLACAGL